jgi:hypothetical protein
MSQGGLLQVIIPTRAVVTSSGVLRVGVGFERRRGVISLGVDTKLSCCGLPRPQTRLITSSDRRPRLALDVKITSWKQFVCSQKLIISVKVSSSPTIPLEYKRQPPYLLITRGNYILFSPPLSLSLSSCFVLAH